MCNVKIGCLFTFTVFSLVVFSKTSPECFIDYEHHVSQPCEKCGVCRKQRGTDALVCDRSYLTAPKGLFRIDPLTNKCVLSSFCTPDTCRAIKNSDGNCISLLATYQCRCKFGYVGQQCQFTYTQSRFPGAGSSAKINNIIYTPIFFSSQYAKIYVVLLYKGIDLKVKLNNGRGEQLIYNERNCKYFKRLDIIKICKSLYNQVINLKLCLGRSSGLSPSWFGGCLMEINMPYPRAHRDSENVIYEYIDGDETNSAVLGKIETVSLAVFNNYSSAIALFQQTFSMVNLYHTEGMSSVSSCVPQVSLLDCGAGMHEMVEFIRFRAFIIKPFIQVDDLDTKCSSLENFMMKWKIWLIVENHNELTDPPIIQVSGKTTLFIKEDTLNYGVYKVKLTVTAVYTHDLIPGTGYCYFKIVQIPIQTMIMGGSYRKIHYTHDIFFSVISQLAPNRFIRSKKIKLIYTWTCQENETFCAPFETSETSRFISGPFRPSVKYIFKLSVKTKEMYYGFEQTTVEHSEIQVIETTSGPALDFSIRCLINCGGFVFKSNPLEIIHLEVVFNKTDGLELLKTLKVNSGPFKWFYIKASDKTSRPVEVRGEMKKTPTENSVLVINDGVLSYNETYVFFAFSSELAKFELQTSRLPSNVNCTISPTSGIQGETYFNIYCIYHRTSTDDISILYEFNDKSLDDERKRIMGYSRTGKLERLLLVGNYVYVNIINLSGALYEYQIKIAIKPPPQRLIVSDLNIGNHLVDDYHYRLNKISTYGDLLEEQDTLDDAIDLLLEALVNEYFVTFQGALQMENTLYHTVCEPKKSIKTLRHKTVYNLAKIIHRVSIILKRYAIDPSVTSRMWITRRIIEVSTATMDCARHVLDATKVDIVDPIAYKYLKTSIYYTTNALNNVAIVVAFHLLPSLLEVNLERKLIKVIVKTMSSNNSLVLPEVVTNSDCIGCMRQFMNYFTILIIYKINPYWWSNGHTINTDVKYFRIFHGFLLIPTYETNYTVDFDLKVNNFGTASIKGFVRQPHPKSSPQINDFLVAVHRIIADSDTVIFINFLDTGNHTNLRLAVLKDQRPDYDYMMTWSTVIEKSQKVEFRTAEIHNYSFVYVGILPEASVNVGTTVNYSFELFSASCCVWRYESWMTGPLCQVDSRSNHTHLHCSCRQLPQTIAGRLSVPHNDLNPFSDIPLLIDITDYPFVSVYLICYLVFYTMILIWTRRKDKEDEQQIYTIILEDNDPRDKFGYLVGVFTGWRIGAGTTSNIGIRLIGEEGISRPHVLHCSTRRVLTANSDDWFLIFTPHHLGALIRVSLWTDYSGSSPNWYCSKLFVCDLTCFETDTFIIEKWFGVTTENIQLRANQEGATYNETNNIARIISENLIYGFREQHLLLSVFCRHPRTLGTRTQRWTASSTGFFVTTATAAFLFSVYTPEVEDIPFFSITRESIIIALISNIAGMSVSLYIMHHFKGCYEFFKGFPGFHNHSDCGDMYHFERQTSESLEGPPHWLKVLGINAIKYLKPWKSIPVQTKEENLVGVRVMEKKLFWCWLCCIITFIMSWNMTIVETIKFAGTKSQFFCFSVITSAMLAAFITPPIKVFVLSCLMAISRTRIFMIIPHSIGLNTILENLKLKDSEEYRNYLYERRSLAMYHPPSLFRVFQLGRKRNTIITVWVLIYSTFCLILLMVLVVLINSFDLNSFSLTNYNICNKLVSRELCQATHHNIKLFNMQECMANLELNILPSLYELKWYNGDNLTQGEEQFAETGWLEDGTARLIGQPRIRQLRVRDLPCPTPSALRNLHTNCQPAQVTPDMEDRGHYSTGWTHDNWTDTLFDQSPWVFQFPTGAKRGSYLRAPSRYWIHRGGYIVSLGRSLAEATRILRSILDTNWIDKNTRITVIGVTIYNANKNLFTVGFIFSEALPIGSKVLGYRVETINLSTNISMSGFCFIIYFVLFTVRLYAFINTFGIKNSLTNFWTLLEFFMFFIYAVSLFLYVNDVLDKAQWLEELQKQGMEVYFDVYVLVNRQFIMKNSVGILFWLAAFRMLRIVRFNNDVRQYIHDLSASKYDIMWTWVTLVLFIFVQHRILFLVVTPPFDSFTGVLTFQSDFKTVIKQYKDFVGKLLAYCLSMTTNIGMFSFILSFAHHYKKRLLLRRMSAENLSDSKHLKRSRLIFD